MKKVKLGQLQLTGCDQCHRIAIYFLLKTD
ncbi:uncharacterized protein METZ01_LOCUS64426 [marine metagenome]|uniref:Uncharacterized protein n=1 Tax=marine metagenome TaxID=408172 RepID=A0A381T5X3_9ZZZZ